MREAGISQTAFTVDVSADGAEGLHYALEFDYDAIILDVMLPGMDGYRVSNSCQVPGFRHHH